MQMNLLDETDPQVDDNITVNRVPRWDGSALVTGSIFDLGEGNIAIPGGILELWGGDFRIQTILDGWWYRQFLALTADDNMTVLVPAHYGFRVTDHANTPHWNNLILNENGELHIPHGDVYARGVKLWSDSRTKIEGQPLDYGLAEVLKLQPERYLRLDWTQDVETGEIKINEQGGINDFGLVAEAVHEIIPEDVSIPEDETKELWSLDYDKLTPVVIKGMQELYQIIEDQQEKIESLEERIAALEQR